MAKRPTFEQACARYIHRFTMDHVPPWAAQTCGAYYYAPQFASDREWFDNTKFPGEPDCISIGGDCFTTGQTWPLGQWLIEPYRKGAFAAPAVAKIPLGFTSTETEISESVDSTVRLRELLADHGESCDDFLIDTYVFEVIAETLTDGSVKRSIRIRPAEPV